MRNRWIFLCTQVIFIEMLMCNQATSLNIIKEYSDAVLASSFHNFGKTSGGKAVLDVLDAGGIQHGIRIPIQVSAAEYRKYGTKGKCPAPKGHCAAHHRLKVLESTSSTSSRYIMPIRRGAKG